ncbi:polyketide synthase [Phyllosticta capitalensis]
MDSFYPDDWQPAVMPIAIVGMSCRMPGEVSTLEDFWRLMSRARSGWSEIPRSRFHKEGYWHPNPEKAGCLNNTGGYFLNQDLSVFDAPFFNITQQEAASMDPQQRILMECTYEALENSGVPKESIIGKKIGVFMGGNESDYQFNHLRDVHTIPMFSNTGNHDAVHSNRVSYYFDLRGPSFTVDTACSSSVYALHSAVQSIRAGESESAIVGAVHVNLVPDLTVSMSMSKLFSEQGKTYAFDHRGVSGFSRGEGCGVLFLKPLDQALKDNDKIRSIIMNTGVNQDGKTVGMSMPNGDAQVDLMREVYTQANLHPDMCGFVEAHGTGTKVGDPVEAEAIHKFFASKARTPRQPLYMGSVKSNIGHLENASGVASVIKAALMLEKGFILPNINFEKPNEKIKLSEWNMKIPTAQRPWPSGKFLVSVNNFGFGGANAHAVLARPPLPPPSSLMKETSTGPKLFVLSGNDEAAANKAMNQLSIFLEQHPEVFQKSQPRNLAYTLGQRRSHLLWRVAMVASVGNDLTLALNNSDTKPARSATNPKVAFVYTGQGAQWATMGRDLLENQTVFAKTMRACDETLEKLGADFSLVEELEKEADDSQVNKAHISQPICTAVQIALTALFQSWGVQPVAVTGHSSGEIGAAYAAGLLSLEDGMAVAYQRGQAVITLKERHPELKGAMLAIGAGPDDVRPMLKTLKDGQAIVACENSPSSITASGDVSAIDELAAAVEQKQQFNRKLRVDVAYHSHHMKHVAEDYRSNIRAVKPQSAQTADFFSALHESKIDGAKVDSSYWVDNLTCPVRFSGALQKLCAEAAPDVLVEIGPHSALEGPIKQVLKGLGKQGSKMSYISTLLRNKNSTVTCLESAGKLFMKGVPLNFKNVNQSPDDPKTPALITELSPYPWNRTLSYWHESRQSKQHRLPRFARHDLLGLLEPTSNDIEPVWRNVLRLDDLPWLRDHKMQSLTTFPGAGFLGIAAEAAAQRAIMREIPFDRFVMREIHVTRPLLLNDGEEYEICTQLRPYAEGLRSYSDSWDEFRISSWVPDKGWTEHSRGLVGVRKGDGTNPVHKGTGEALKKRMQEARDKCNQEIHMPTFYEQLKPFGAIYGPTFRNIVNCRACDEHSVAEVEVPDTAAVMPFNYETPTIVHTSFLDLILQLAYPILGAGRSKLPSLYMPISMTEFTLSRNFPNKPGQKLHVTASGRPDYVSPKPTDFSMDGIFSPEDEEASITFTGLRLTPVRENAEQENTGPRELCYKTEWEALDVVENGPEAKDGKETEATNGVNGLPNGVNGNDGLKVNTKGHSRKHSAHSRNHSSSGAPIYTPPDEVKRMSGLRVEIITEKSGDDLLVTSLKDAIAIRTDIEPTVSRLVDSDPSDKICVVMSEIQDALLANATPQIFSAVQKVLTKAEGVLWVTKGAYKTPTNPNTNMAAGLTRTIRSEAAAKAATLDLDPVSKLETYQRVELIVDVFRKVFAQEELDADMEFTEEKGCLVVPRVVPDEEMNLFVHRETQDSEPYLQPFNQPGRRLRLAIASPGALDTLYFEDEEAWSPNPLGDSEIEIQVAATGMNFKDVVIAMGQLPNPYLGVECSGTVTRVGHKVENLFVGDRVCAMSQGAYSTFTRCPSSSAARIPADMSFEVAASIPVVYNTAYYGLVDLGRLTRGERVLIHAAAGGVGQAAIQLAYMIGAEVFATVGSNEKKKLIMEKYGVPEDHIFYSRDTSFGKALREATNGEGVDVVMNSLAGDILRETWDCLAKFGRFIEIGKRDITSNTRLEMAKFNNNATFSSIDLTVVAEERPKLMRRIFSSVMKLIEFGNVKPISPINVMGISQVENAFRALQGGKTTGKLVITTSPGEKVKATHVRQNKLFKGDATYVIIGGTGGLGRSMSRWMVSKGARNIVLMSRSGKATGKIAELIEDLRPVGGNIVVKACDIADQESVNALVEDCAKTLPPIRGVIHAAMVLRDMLFEKMCFDDYQTVIQSKVAGAWNTHNALKDTKLDFFIALSSAAGIIGNRGQAAYAAANTFLDAFVKYRLSQGLPGVSIDLTAIEGVGYLAENADRQDEIIQNLGGETSNEAEVLALVSAAVTGLTAKTCGGHCLTGLKFRDNQLPYYANEGRFAHLKEQAIALSAEAGAAAGQSISIAQRIKQAKSADDATDALSHALLEKLSTILMIPLDDMDAARGVTTYGLDSLNAIELRNWITRELQANLQVLELLTSGSLKNLAHTVLKKTKMEHPHQIN